MLAALAVGGAGANRATDEPGEELVGKLGAGNAAETTEPADPTDPPVDGDPDLPATAPPPDDVDGLWIDSSTDGAFYLAIVGGQVRALRGEKWVCRPEGPVRASAAGVSGYPATDVYFEGMRRGDDLNGEVQVCWHGADSEPYWAPAPLHLSLAGGRDRITGTWHDDLVNADVDLTLTRLAEKLLTAEDFGLPSTNLRVYDYGIKKVHRADGTIASVAEDYVSASEADDRVVRHVGIDLTSRNEAWVVDTVPFSAPVGGTIHLYPGSAWNTLAIRLDTGDWLQFLHASDISVRDGDRVEAGTVLGKTGSTGTTVVHLHVQAKDADGQYLNPDRVVDRARRIVGSRTAPTPSV